MSRPAQSDPVKVGIQAILKGDLTTMQEQFNTALSQKAAQKLEEKKVEIASTYFGIK